MGIYKASWVKPSFVVLTSGHSDAQRWASECPDVKNYKWRLNPVWHRMLLYSCTHMATVGVRVNVTDFAIGPNQKVPQRCWHLQHDAHSWKQQRAFSARLKQSGVLELAARVAAGIYTQRMLVMLVGHCLSAATRGTQRSPQVDDLN